MSVAHARRLRQGREVAAEEYESATVVFCDIADFGTISATSPPMQIVDFLNDVYTFTDNHLINYDVYKVRGSLDQSLGVCVDKSLRCLSVGHYS